MNRVKKNLLKQLMIFCSTLVLIGNNLFAQDLVKNNSLTGTVISEAGELLEGVSVKVSAIKGTETVNVNTNKEGKFQINSLKVGMTYRISFNYVGFENQVIKELLIKEGNGNSILIRLKQLVNELNNVVVVGYGTVRKADLTGVVGSLKSTDFQERPAINAEQSLAGKLAGVNVSTNSGKPGGRTSISIRGFSSINASNDPLYIVDGVEWTEGLSNLNPNDIETMDVLKDASATAIYGTRGSNGVIIVTTKRGTKNSNQVSYDTYVSFNQLPPARNLKVLTSRQWMDLEEVVYKNAQKYDPTGYQAGKYIDPLIKRKAYLKANVFNNRELFTLDANGIPQPIYEEDWSKNVFRTGISQSHNLSITGKNNNTNYGFFVGFADENGIIKESFQKRYNVRITLDQTVKSWLKIGATVSHSKKSDGGVDDSNGSYSVIRNIVEMVPFIPYKYSDGTYGYGGDYSGLEKLDNPLSEVYENKILNKTNAFNGDAYVNFKIISGLEFTSTFGANIINEINPRFNSSKLQGGTRKNSSNINSSESSFWVWSNRLNYTKRINEHHTINLLLGAEQQALNYLSWNASTSLMPDDYYEYSNLGAGATPLAPSSYANAYQMKSYFGRINYTLNNKYLFTATSRFDGSSRFGDNNKFAFFPSGAFAWKISEENFLKNNKTISNLKLRLSYGLTGNSTIGSYRSLASLSTNSYIFGSRVTGVSIGRLANPDLKWEKTRQFNIGAELGLFKNKINITLDAYYKKTVDLLLDAPVPSTSGFTTVTKNIGNMENKGLEITLNTTNIENRKFNWVTNFNFSWLKNKVLALGANNEDIIYGFKDNQIIRVGESVGSIFGYIRDGIYSNDQVAQALVYGKKPGDVIIRDLNSDGKINANDRAIIGKGIPDFYGTFSNSFKYNNFSLILEIQYQSGNQIFNNTRNSSEGRFGIANNYATVLDSWTPSNQGAVLEELRPIGYSYFMDTRKLTDGSFIRGKNLLLGYNFEKSLTKKIGISSLRVFASLQNFFLITDYFGYDPELNNYNTAFSQGITYTNYPKPRTLMIGLNVTF
ncbi:MAG: TonB-dependent receptor [Chitinophagaceae bacterium]|nr:TonB-dependent receptor [Chitinophagaceae bacterium]